MTAMIALIGEQTLPNFLPIKHYQPESVVLIYTERTKKTYEKLSATLQKEVKVLGLETHAYDIGSITKSINDMLDAIPELSLQPLQFNLTGGTKAMVLAAYQVASSRQSPIMYLQSEGKRTHVFHYKWENQQLKAANDEFLPELLNLRDVFDLHLGPGNWREEGASKEEGGTLEEAIANTLRDGGYEVMVGVKTMNNNIEVDVAVRSGNQYGVIQAKMGKGGRSLDSIKQLSTTARLLGTYSQMFSVITVPQESTQKMIADASNIQVLSLPTYERGSRVLPAAEATKLLATVEKILKG